MLKKFDTIAAISTPLGKSGIGIIRISGPDSVDIATAISTTTAHLSTFQNSPNRKLIHAHIFDHDAQNIDEVLIAIMPAHRSYTGELTVEINCHGGRAVIAAILRRVLESGARLADPGEFTRRAVENNRLDLVQAEAVNDLINAKSTIALKAARRQIEGGLSKSFKQMRSNLINVLSKLTYILDIDPQDQEEMIGLEDDIIEIKKSIDSMLDTARRSELISHGIWIAISGPPNAGKSTIFNLLLKMERSLVSNLPGTTRDHIAEAIEIEGVEVRLIDTAGIRDTHDELERASIEKSLDQVRAAHLVLVVIDQSEPLTDSQRNELEEHLKESNLIIINKCDLKADESVDEFINGHNNRGMIRISAKSGFQVERIIEAIGEWIRNHNVNENSLTINQRHIKLLNDALGYLASAQRLMTAQAPLDIIYYEVNLAVNAFENILGIITNDEVIDNIFLNFCVGK